MQKWFCTVFMWKLSQTSADAPSQFATKWVNLGHLLPFCSQAGTQIRGWGNWRNLVLWGLWVVGWGRGGRGRRGGGGRSGGLGSVGRCGAAGSRLGSVMVDTKVWQRTGQVEASDPGGDGGVEGELSCSDGGGGSWWDGQRRWRGELPAETRRFVINVLRTSVVLIGGKEQLQGPERGQKQLWLQNNNYYPWKCNKRLELVYLDAVKCKRFCQRCKILSDCFLVLERYCMSDSALWNALYLEFIKTRWRIGNKDFNDSFGAFS